MPEEVGVGSRVGRDRGGVRRAAPVEVYAFGALVWIRNPHVPEEVGVGSRVGRDRGGVHGPDVLGAGSRVGRDRGGGRGTRIGSNARHTRLLLFLLAWYRSMSAPSTHNS